MFLVGCDTSISETKFQMYANWIVYLFRVPVISMSINDHPISAKNIAENEYYLVLTYVHGTEKIKISCNMLEKKTKNIGFGYETIN